jgi:glycosidase
MISIRKANPVLIYGKYIPLLEQSKTVFAYLREYANNRCLILLNFSDMATEIQLKTDLKDCNFQLLIGNIRSKACKIDGKFELKPYEARVYNL